MSESEIDAVEPGSGAAPSPPGGLVLPCLALLRPGLPLPWGGQILLNHLQSTGPRASE